jgi:CheY-like chemotaxis protein
MPPLSETVDNQTTVLVLEDEAGLADLYTAWLSDEYSVRTAYTAAEAREKIDGSVDLALIDRRLPDESGDEVLDWISQHHSHCRRAMVTAVDPDVDIVEMPFDDYLVKPIIRSDFEYQAIGFPSYLRSVVFEITGSHSGVSFMTTDVGLGPPQCCQRSSWRCRNFSRLTTSGRQGFVPQHEHRNA